MQLRKRHPLLLPSRLEGLHRVLEMVVSGEDSAASVHDRGLISMHFCRDPTVPRQLCGGKSPQNPFSNDWNEITSLDVERSYRQNRDGIDHFIDDCELSS